MTVARLTLTPKLTRLFLNGAPLSLTQFTLRKGGVAVWSEAGEFLGIAAPDQEAGRLVTRKLFKLL